MPQEASPQGLVQDFLRAQNLEQLGRTEEAISIYEQVVAAGFDSAGPYDRLIWIYQNRGMNRDVIRIAEASLKAVRTYPQKREWYERQIAEARKQLVATPEPRG